MSANSLFNTLILGTHQSLSIFITEMNIAETRYMIFLIFDLDENLNINQFFLNLGVLVLTKKSQPNCTSLHWQPLVFFQSPKIFPMLPVW